MRENELYNLNYDGVNFSPYDFRDKQMCVKNYILEFFARTCRMFIYENLPETMNSRDIEKMLQLNTKTLFIEKNGKKYAVNCGIKSCQDDPNYNPTEALVTNIALNIEGKTYKLGEDAVLIYNDSARIGLLPIFRRYATTLMENDITINLLDIQKRAVALLSANDDKSKVEMELFYKSIFDGNLKVVADKTILNGIKVQPMATTGVANVTEFIELNQYQKASLFNSVGLNANYNMKRESLNSNESQLNEDALLSFVDDMYECRKEGIEKVNKMFGLNIVVKKSSAWAIRDENLNNSEETKEVNEETKEEVKEGANND